MTNVTRDMVVRSWKNGEPSVVKGDTSVQAVVFVHGILSDHRRFRRCQKKLSRRYRGWEFHYVDYEFHDGIAENGERLRRSLQVTFRAQDRVTIVAHSMGGLVARIACLNEGAALRARVVSSGDAESRCPSDVLSECPSTDDTRGYRCSLGSPTVESRDARPYACC